MKKGQFSEKVVAVTGAARGIGKNIARAFGQEGANVAVCDIDQTNGSATAFELAQLGVQAEFVTVDLSQKGAPQAMVQQIVKKFGKIDILVNNARVGCRLGCLEADEDTWDNGMSVMLRAAFFASQEAIKAMSIWGGGSIVNISSVAASLACHESPTYHVAKAGLLQMTRYLAMHAGTYGVRVNALLPGFIVKDESLDKYEREENLPYKKIVEFCHPMGRAGTSSNVADAVLFLCSEKASFIAGQCLVVDGGLTVQEPSDLLLRYSRGIH